MRRWALTWQLLVLLLVTPLWLAACATLSARPDPAPREMIVFGATISITGARAEEGRYTRDGYLFYVESINAAGGIAVGGRRYPVKLVYYDDASRPERVADLYEKLIDEDRVDFLLGPFSSQLTAVAAPVAEEHGIPMLSAHAAAERVFSRDNRYNFSIISPARNYLRGIIALVLAKDPRARTVALLAADDPFAREALEGAANYAGERDLTIVHQALYLPNAPDLSPLLREVKDKEPDMLLVAGHLQDSLLIVKQARELGLAPKALGFTVGPSSLEFRANLRADADYILGATQWTSDLNYTGIEPWPTPRDYTEAFLATYPEYSEVPYHVAESTAALVAYQQAIENAGTFEREAVCDSLASLDIMTFYGRIKFDERGMNVYKPMAVEQLHPDGEKYTVYPFEIAAKDLLYPMPPWNDR
jgi:branched-chain amino acid transport system substrate-binding protein